jgi:hypothetical protein
MDTHTHTHTHIHIQIGRRGWLFAKTKSSGDVTVLHVLMDDG